MTKGDTADVETTFDEIVGLEATGCELVRVSRADDERGEGARRAQAPDHDPARRRHPLLRAARARGDRAGRRQGAHQPGQHRHAATRSSGSSAPPSDKGVAMRIGVNSGSIRERKAPLGDRRPTRTWSSSACARRSTTSRSSSRSSFYDTRDLDQGAPRRPDRRGEPPPRRVVRLPDPPRRHARGLGRARDVKSRAAFGILLAEGIGDTIRVSITGDNRQEVQRRARAAPGTWACASPSFDVYACPSCGRAEVDLIGLTKKVEEATKGLTYPCRVAVMGCIVNGPGEAAEADVSVSAGQGVGFIYRGSKMIKKVQRGRHRARAPRRDRRLDRREESHRSRLTRRAGTRRSPAPPSRRSTKRHGGARSPPPPPGPLLHDPAVRPDAPSLVVVELGRVDRAADRELPAVESHVVVVAQSPRVLQLAGAARATGTSWAF